MMRPQKGRRAGRALRAFVVAALLGGAALLAQAGPLLAETSGPATPAPPAFDVRPDYAGMADSFLSGATGWSPAMLGRYLDAREMAEIGVSLAAGDVAGASRKTMEFVGEKAIGSVPVIGQWYALGTLGQSVGSWAIDHFGSERFDSAYRSMSAHFSDAEWSRAYGDPGLDVELVIVENANVLTWIDRQAGGGRSNADLRRMFWDMLRARHQFDALCDHYGLAGADRTYDALQAKHLASMAAMAELARAIEAERTAAEKAKLEAKWRADQDAKAGKDAARAAREAEICNAWLGKVGFDPDRHPPRPSPDLVKELCGEAPPPDATADQDIAPDNPAVDEPATAPASTAYSPAAGHAGAISWSVATSSGGSQTVLQVTLVNTAATAVDGVTITARAASAYSSGGVAAGSKAAALAPRQSRTIPVVVTGDIDAVSIAVVAGGQTIATLALPTPHDKRARGDGQFSGSYAGAGNSGSIALTISGRAVTGSLTGGYSDADQTVSITCEVKGSFDPKSGAIIAEWGGRAIGRFTGKDSAGKINEAVSGTLSGALSGDTLAGSWSGGSEFLQDTGKWSATR